MTGARAAVALALACAACGAGSGAHPPPDSATPTAARADAAADQAAAPAPDAPADAPRDAGADRPPGATDAARSDAAGPDVAPTRDAMAALPDGPPSSAPPEARVLDGQRFDLPCTHVDGECKVTPPNAPTVVVNRTVTFGGAPGTTYHVTLRFRGVVERKIITGGVLQDPYFRIGGTPSTSHYNEYSLRVSSPRAVYYLNDGPKENTWCVAVDYTKTVDIDGGAQVTLFADSHNDQQIENRDDKGKPIVFPGLPPAPLPYDGQFLQIDVVSVTR